MTRWIKKASLCTVAFVLACIQMTTASAVDTSENPDLSSETVDSGLVIVDGQDWENPETGEYFRWLDEVPTTRGTIAKEFEFKIRTSVLSSGFSINSTAVDIYANAKVRNGETNKVLPGYDDAVFSVTLIRVLWSKTISGTVGDGLSGSISGLTSGTNHQIRITNKDRLPDGYYLVGDGTVQLA